MPRFWHEQEKPPKESEKRQKQFEISNFGQDKGKKRRHKETDQRQFANAEVKETLQIQAALEHNAAVLGVQ